jgi:bisphosphoglycerate-dependent phosphoglycerate mutase
MTTIAAQIGRTRAAVDKLKEEPFKASRPEVKDTPTNETRSGGRTYSQYQKDKANSVAQDTERRVKGEKREYDVDMAARKERRKEMMKGASGLRRGSTLRDQGLSDNKPSSSVASKQENYYKNKK